MFDVKVIRDSVHSTEPELIVAESCPAIRPDQNPAARRMKPTPKAGSQISKKVLPYLSVDTTQLHYFALFHNSASPAVFIPAESLLRIAHSWL